jgi:hypothetical protein|tara:strand:- start:174 stop:566 length:393 start_codon:yes stop_codon:yes gene_type:complete
MGDLAKTYSFTPGTSIVAAQVNENFDDVVDWATGAPTLSTSGSATTVSGTLSVTELATFADDVYLSGSNQRLVYEGSAANDFETFIAVTNATADRTITFPDATGTVALTSDITSPTWNDANNILTNSVFN